MKFSITRKKEEYRETPLWIAVNSETKEQHVHKTLWGLLCLLRRNYPNLFNQNKGEAA